MTKQEFDLKYRGENVAVHCDTEEKAKAFLSLAKSFGYKWNGGDDLEDFSYWYVEKEKTCYRVISNGVMTGDKIFYQAYGRTIVEFELDEPKETFKIGDVVYTKMGFKAKIVDTAWIVEYAHESGTFFKRNNELTHKKPLKKITKEQLAEMGYEVE